MTKIFLTFFILYLILPCFKSQAAEKEEVADEKIEHSDQVKQVDYKTYDSWLDTHYSLFSHKGTFILPFSHNWRADESLYAPASALSGNNHTLYEKTEAELQISFMIPLYRRVFGQEWDWMFAYTHHAWWQLYNSSWSKPFRESNYTPELFVRRLDRHPYRMLGLDIIAYDLGYVHESNGQVQVLSRSWDRLFARAYLRSSERIFIILSGWMRFPESEEADDNPDILKYMGIGDLEFYYRIREQSLSFRVPISSHPGFDLRYSRPWTSNLRWFLSYRVGYGHSLIEYDRDVQRFGVGVILESFLDRGGER